MRQAPIPPVRTPQLYRPERSVPSAAPSRSWWVVLGACAALVALVLLWPKGSARPAAAAPTLEHARELVSHKLYADAVKEGKALLQGKCQDPRAVRELVAQAAVSGGLWEEAVAQYKLLGKTRELKKAQRILGDLKLDAARQALAAGNVVPARDLGKQALALLKAGQAENARLATAYALLGQATYLLDQLPASKGYLTQAVALAPGDADSRATLTKVRAKLAPAPPPPPVANYVPPPEAREQTVLVVPSTASQSAYPTYEPKPRYGSSSYSDYPTSSSSSSRSSYTEPVRTTPPSVSSYSPAYQSPSSSRRRSSSSSSYTPSSRVSDLRERESLLHRYR